MEGFLELEVLIIILLFIISIISIAMRLIKLPYTVALVLVGLALAFQGSLEVELTEEVILFIFIPPLIFEAAFHVNFDDLKENIVSILFLAIPGVLIVTFIISGVMIWGAGLSITTALVFGALIAATDPVAVVAIFKEVGVPKKLAVLVEGESLLNDGTAIVVFNIILGIAVTGHFNAVEGFGEFLLVSGGGVIIGLGLGWVCARLISAIDDHLIETTLTTALAYGVYLIAEEVHVSGVLAVVAAGVLNGNVSPKGMSATTKVVLFSFWEYLAFLANSLIFLLIGLEINLQVLLSIWPTILMAGVGLLLARAIAVYSLSWIAGRFKYGRKIPLKWQHILTWGGLKGAISLALALGLPATLGPDREFIIALTFGVVLLTLLVQATTMRPLITKLGIIARTTAELAYEKNLGQLLALKAARKELNQLHNNGLIPPAAWDILSPELKTKESTVNQTLHTLIENEPSIQDDVIAAARRDLLLAQRGTLHTLNRDGLISEHTFEELVTTLDAELDELHL